MKAWHLIIVALFLLQKKVAEANAIRCEFGKPALDRLKSYYTWWYQFSHWWFHSTKICQLNEMDSKTVCTEVARACYLQRKDTPLEQIFASIKISAKCEKKFYRTVETRGDSWENRKRMYQCGPFTTSSGEQVADFWVSAGGTSDSALTFAKHGPSYIELDRLVSGLTVLEHAQKRSSNSAQKPPSSEHKT